MYLYYRVDAKLREAESGIVNVKAILDSSHHRFEPSAPFPPSDPRSNAGQILYGDFRDGLVPKCVSYSDEQKAVENEYWRVFKDLDEVISRKTNTLEQIESEVRKLD